MPKRNHAIVLDESRCNGCVACSMACPTRALRVRSNLVRADWDRCIDCGACIGACQRDALRPRTSSSADLERFKYKVAIPSLVLYGQFGDDVRPGQILHAFRSVGFDLACDISWMCEMVAAAIDAYLTDCSGPWPKISITCPAVLRLMQLEYPSLLPHLVPINTPRELAAKLHRRRIATELGLDPGDIGLFYISPCTSLVDTIESPLGRRTSHLDGAFSIAELYGPLLRAIKSDPGATSEETVSIRGLRWVMANGEIPGMRNENSITVKGLQGRGLRARPHRERHLRRRATSSTSTSATTAASPATSPLPTGTRRNVTCTRLSASWAIRRRSRNPRSAPCSSRISSTSNRTSNRSPPRSTCAICGKRRRASSTRTSCAPRCRARTAPPAAPPTARPWRATSSMARPP